ncbi:MAG: UDP-N-acetylmuramoyl-L-alanine--D-glutamate ligase [Deltaproteobacteria bacterium]|nr:UDP-N-acetylmuramoyl-L-alanine--D-glutamate ligase [Deltaproteobacteria bacterium]
MDVGKKKVLVVGLGESGLSVSRWLSHKGARVRVSEIKRLSDLDPRRVRELSALGVEIETGAHREETFLDAELIIVSPGVPMDVEPLMKARHAGIPVVCELGFAAEMIQEPIIAITGTNGKSTTTSLIGSILREAGAGGFVGGNIGRPLMDYLSANQRAEYVVVEVSSFQLDTMDAFTPTVSVILNVSPDHLDRHGSFDSYVQSKLRIFKNQGPGSFLIINDDDPILSPVEPPSGVSVLRFGKARKENRHAFVDGEAVRVRLKGEEEQIISLEDCRLRGEHNVDNLMASLLCVVLLGISSDPIQGALARFKGLPHRLEFIMEIEGRAFYDDSKATNVDAAVKSMSSFDRPVILIAGGKDKGEDYSFLAEASKGRVRKAVLLGESTQLLARSFDGVVSYDRASSMEDAVSKAFDSSVEGDVILLAPACSSFDMFRDYAHRGEVFREAVERLSNGKQAKSRSGL